jgi:hypothetical protein
MNFGTNKNRQQEDTPLLHRTTFCIGWTFFFYFLLPIFLLAKALFDMFTSYPNLPRAQ